MEHRTNINNLNSVVGIQNVIITWHAGRSIVNKNAHCRWNTESMHRVSRNLAGTWQERSWSREGTDRVGAQQDHSRNTKSTW